MSSLVEARLVAAAEVIGMDGATDSTKKAASRVHAGSAVQIIRRVSDRLLADDVARLSAIASRIPWIGADGTNVCTALYDTHTTRERADRRPMQDYIMLIDYVLKRNGPISLTTATLRFRNST